MITLGDQLQHSNPLYSITDITDSRGGTRSVVTFDNSSLNTEFANIPDKLKQGYSLLLETSTNKIYYLSGEPAAAITTSGWTLLSGGGGGGEGPQGVQGAQGVQGSRGNTGNPGPNSLIWKYDTFGAGNMATNSAAYSALTNIYISETSKAGYTINNQTTGNATSWLSNIIIGTKISITNVDSPSSYGIYQVTSAATNDVGGLNYRTLNLTFISGNGNIGGTSTLVTISYINEIAGPQGNQGPQGPVSGTETTSQITSDLEVGAILAQQIIPIGTNLQEFATLLLKKTFNPTLTGPTFSLTNNAGTREVGTSASFNLSFNFNRGNILGASVGGVWQPTTSQGSRAGTATSWTINGITQSGAGGNVLSVSPVLVPGGNTFAGTVTYGAGIQPLNSIGGNFDSPLAGGTSPAQSTAVTGIYPYFWYKSSSPITAANMQTFIANGTATKVLLSSTGTITIDFDATGQYLAFAYPSSSATKTAWEVSTLNAGAIPGGLFGGPTVLSCNSPESPTPLWSNVSYKIHTTAGVISELNPIQLKN